MIKVRSLFPVAALSFAALAAPACQKASALPSPEHPVSPTPGPPASPARPAASSAFDRWPPADSAINEAVASELRRDSQLDRAGVHFATTNGVVELTGQIDNPLAKERATRIVQAVRGVRAVSNLLRIAPPKRPDQDIQRDVQRALLYTAATAKMPIRVGVQNAVPVLTGSVRSWQERQLAELVADGVRGVRFTQNDLTVVASRPWTSVNIVGDVEARLGWDALIEHDPIAVAVEGRRVTLTGKARSAAEKSRAADDAWVEGVEGVDASAVEVTPWTRPEKNLPAVTPRSDHAIAAAISDAALSDPRIASTELVPDVKGGAVTLTGTVATLRARRAAEAVAQNTVGVVSVDNQLVVRGSQSTSDQELQSRLEQALIFDPLTDARSIHVAVKGGRVTLTGSVETFFESAEAFDVASRLANVLDVDDSLTVRDQKTPFASSPWLDPYAPNVDNRYLIRVRPAASDGDIKQRIEAEFARNTFIVPEGVQVDVENGKAVLVGTVRTYRERQAAADSAVAAGASEVDNQLKVQW